MSNEQRFSKLEVEKHNTAESLWVIYEDKVCELTAYYPMHPGGSAMLRYAGKDVTCVLSTVNAHGFAWTFIMNKLEECCIGRVDK